MSFAISPQAEYLTPFFKRISRPTAKQSLKMGIVRDKFIQRINDLQAMNEELSQTNENLNIKLKDATGDLQNIRNTEYKSGFDYGAEELESVDKQLAMITQELEATGLKKDKYESAFNLSKRAYGGLRGILERVPINEEQAKNITTDVKRLWIDLHNEDVLGRPLPQPMMKYVQNASNELGIPIRPQFEPFKDVRNVQNEEDSPSPRDVKSAELDPWKNAPKTDESQKTSSSADAIMDAQDPYLYLMNNFSVNMLSNVRKLEQNNPRLMEVYEGMLAKTNGDPSWFDKNVDVIIRNEEDSEYHLNQDFIETLEGPNEKEERLVQIELLEDTKGLHKDVKPPEEGAVELPEKRKLSQDKMEALLEQMKSDMTPRDSFNNKKFTRNYELFINKNKDLPKEQQDIILNAFRENAIDYIKKEQGLFNSGKSRQGGYDSIATQTDKMVEKGILRGEDINELANSKDSMFVEDLTSKLPKLKFKRS